jgi:hypothetical protein
MRRVFLSSIPFTRKKTQQLLKEEIPSRMISFPVEAEKIFQKIQTAFLPLLPLNPHVTLQIQSDEIRLNIQPKGLFYFKIDHTREELHLSTPYSEPCVYLFCPDTLQWLSKRDGHDFRGMIIRDWLRGYVGCPHFD